MFVPASTYNSPLQFTTLCRMCHFIQVVCALTTSPVFEARDWLSLDESETTLIGPIALKRSGAARCIPGEAPQIDLSGSFDSQLRRLQLRSTSVAPHPWSIRKIVVVRQDEGEFSSLFGRTCTFVGFICGYNVS